MAHQTSPRVYQLALKMPHELFRQLEKEALEHKMNVSAYIRHILTEAMLDVELTEEDYEIIKARIAAATERTNR